MLNIDSLTRKFSGIVASHELGEGKYTRWLWQDAKGNRQLGNNEYGCADAANILYTIGEFPTGKKREECLNALLNLQNSETGLFTECTHHPIHTTAHCIAAIELFDARPRYPLTDLKQYHTKEGLYGLLNSLWGEGKDPWPHSHQGAGIYAASVLAGEVDLQWQRDYFQWIWDNTDPKYGMSKTGEIDRNLYPMANHMCGWFHYTFNTEYGRQPMRYPDKMIDTNLYMYNTKTVGSTFGRWVGFREIDWVFTMSRAMRQTTHRFEEGRKALLEFGLDYVAWLDSLDPEKDDGLNDLHMLFGAACAVAELQRALPGEFESTVPWKLVLDRRPFI